MKPSSWRHAVLAVIFGLLLSVSAHAQQDRISLNLNDAPLKQLFTEIERKSRIGPKSPYTWTAPRSLRY